MQVTGRPDCAEVLSGPCGAEDEVEGTAGADSEVGGDDGRLGDCDAEVPVWEVESEY